MTVKGDILQHLKPVLIDVNAWTVIFGLSVILDLSLLLHDLVRSKDVYEGCYGGYSPDALEKYHQCSPIVILMASLKPRARHYAK